MNNLEGNRQRMVIFLVSECIRMGHERMIPGNS